MKNYRMYFYVGNDSRSHSGHWRRVCVDANNLSEAKTIAYEKLNDENLLDVQLGGFVEDGIVRNSFYFSLPFFCFEYVQAGTMEKARKKILRYYKDIKYCREITDEILIVDAEWPENINCLTH